MVIISFNIGIIFFAHLVEGPFPEVVNKGEDICFAD